MQKHNKSLLKSLAAGLLLPLAVGGGIVYCDTYSYQNALSSLANSKDVVKLLEQSKLEIEADVNLHLHCSKIEKKDDDSQGYRSCLIAQAPKIRTQNGAHILAITASMWLEKHPDDIEMRDSALEAIEAGWKDLDRSEPINKLWGNISDAHNKSVLLVIKDGVRQSSYDYEQTLYRALEHDEVLVLDPKLVKKQNDRKFSKIKLEMAKAEELLKKKTE